MKRYDVTDENGKMIAFANVEELRILRYFDKIIDMLTGMPPAPGFAYKDLWPAENAKEPEYEYKPRIRMEMWDTKDSGKISLMLCCVYNHKYIAVNYKEETGKKSTAHYTITFEMRGKEKQENMTYAKTVKTQAEAIEEIQNRMACT